MLEPLESPLHANTALLVSAKRNIGCNIKVGVDPDTASADLTCHPLSTGYVLAPNRCTEPGLESIGPVNDVLLG